MDVHFQSQNGLAGPFSPMEVASVVCVDVCVSRTITLVLPVVHGAHRVCPRPFRVIVVNIVAHLSTIKRRDQHFFAYYRLLWGSVTIRNVIACFRVLGVLRYIYIPNC